MTVRFDFPDMPKKAEQLWMVFDAERTEVCRTNPGFDEDLIVTADSSSLAERHLGRIEWPDALRAGRITVAGPSTLARALPTWNQRSGWARIDTRREATEAEAN